MVVALNHNPFEGLATFLIAFLNKHPHPHRISNTEGRHWTLAQLRIFDALDRCYDVAHDFLLRV